ncbi:MAG: N-acetyl sugar amidotransferase [Candidatus Staskawiczbacteria bacterium]|nr:N-acetyl sugar amidotransferase [Candidatus Staskawiczbacteria bacterium]MBI3337248.1 N-acetyl sugar amidotransferase [Candidatus Staskawiczbacteria bacterium]
MTRPPKATYCTKCVYPSSSAVPLIFDENGVCSGCRVFNQTDNIDWGLRKEMLKKIVAKYKTNSNYDCIIPVSGGKDSYFQTHYVIKELGLRPLLVTYHGNNFLPIGEENLENMRHAFNADHIIFRPSETLLKKINKKCFYLMGDMNWHNHCGIFTYPVQVAVKMNIPLIIWGEHGYVDLGGMYSMNDFIEMTRKFRDEHACRGYDFDDMIDEKLGIKEQDVLWAKYPTDKELEDVGVRGIYLGNFIPWDANAHVKLMMDTYGWKKFEGNFDRTYRKFSNLDDMHENGVHDYLKYIKFGYGRASDHASKDIRRGYITREQGIEMVKKYDHVKPSDLKRWLEYVDMTEDEFDRVCDTFRDPRVWWKDEKGEWVKDNIWDKD